MVKLIKKKVEGSTLIEVLIAMVIIMIVFAIAIKVFNNVLSSGVSYQKIKVQNQLNVLSEQVKKDGYISESKLALDSIVYEFTTDTSGVANVSKLEIKATQNGRVLGNVKCLYKVNAANEEN